MSLALTQKQPEVLLAWAAQRVDLMTGRWPDGSIPVGVIDVETGKIRAVMVTLETYAGIIDCHFASDGTRTWASPRILNGIFGYLFFTRGARRAQTATPVKNTPAIVMNYKLGWVFEGNARAMAEDGGDAVMLSMTPDVCKWIKETGDG